jgi:hypothetical protein
MAGVVTTTGDMNRTLREALELDGIVSSEHRQRVEGLALVHSHSIAYRDLVEQSTCVTYALGFNGNPTYRAIALKGPFAGRQFMELLVQDCLAEIASPQTGCLACYFAAGVWKHVGTVTSNFRIVSQWGTFPVYEHDLFEVPQSYGDHVRWFVKPEISLALGWFIEYADGIATLAQ